MRRVQSKTVWVSLAEAIGFVTSLRGTLRGCSTSNASRDSHTEHEHGFSPVSVPRSEFRPVAPPAFPMGSTVPLANALHSSKISNELLNREEGTEDYIYCALTDKTLLRFGPEMKLMETLGFGINDKKHIAVVNPALLNSVGVQLRDAESESHSNFMHKWPRWLKNGVGKILLNRNFVDHAAEVQRRIDDRLIKHRLRRAAVDVQNSVGDPSSDAAAASSSNASSSTTVDETLNVKLNEEQQAAVKLVEQGYNVYIGGSAGTGKTVLIRAIVRRLTNLGLKVAVTATTGIAGCHIGGSTFHHALGCTVHNEFVRREELLAYNVVIIDEISMMSMRLFEEFDRCSRAETGAEDIPFGGVQMIVCGDFLQLGSINDKSILTSRVFQEKFVKFKLMTQIRQASDAFFASQLAIMRHGHVPHDMIRSLKTLPAGTLEPHAVNLLPTNVDVMEANEKELERLPGNPILFTPLHLTPTIKHKTSATIVLQLDKILPFDKPKLEKALQDEVHRKASWMSNAYISCYQQYQDAYALRIVFPEAATPEWCIAANNALLEFVTKLHMLNCGARVFEVYENPEGRHPIELEETFADLQKKHPVAQKTTFKIGCRVLLRSNLTTGLVNGTIGTVVGFAPCHIDSIPRFLRDATVEGNIAKYHQFCSYEALTEPLLPVVRFHSGEEIAVPPVDFAVGGTSATHHYSVSTIAVPLTLAYAFTVHKVQGLTLVGRVHLELSKMWPCDHLLYVAMSRVKNPDQLSISGFKDDMIIANSDAVAFDETLPSVFSPSLPSGRTVSMWKAVQLQAMYGGSLESAIRATPNFAAEVAAAAELSSLTSSRNRSPKRISATSNTSVISASISDNEAAPKKPQTAQEKRIQRMARLVSKMREKHSTAVTAMSSKAQALR